MNRLDAVTKTRRIAGDTLTAALKELLSKPDPISELALRDRWLSKLRQYQELFPDGWYTPPPHGMFVVFGTDADPSRTSPKSFRPPEVWPRDDIYLDREHGIAAVYASPVDRATGMIGDFGLVLYFGKNAGIKTVFRNALTVNYELFDWLKPGQTFAQIAAKGAELMAAKGLYSDLLSPTDPTGTNIGHSVPASTNGWAPDEQAILGGKDWEAAASLISHRRAFLNAIDDTRTSPGLAHTLEPRPLVKGRPDLPMAWFHTIVTWENGHKRLHTGFDEIFRLTGMDYMLDIR